MSALASWSRPRPRAGARWQSSTGVEVPSRTTFQLHFVALGRYLPPPPRDSRSTLFGERRGADHFQSTRNAAWFEYNGRRTKYAVELLFFLDHGGAHVVRRLVLAPGCLSHRTALPACHTHGHHVKGARPGPKSRRFPWPAGSQRCWPWESTPEKNGCRRGSFSARWRASASGWGRARASTRTTLPR